MAQPEDSQNQKDDSTTGGLNAQSSGMVVDAGVKSALKLTFRMKSPPVSEPGLATAATAASSPPPDIKEPLPDAEKTETDQASAQPAPSEQKAVAEKEPADGRLAAFAAMFFFLCGISFYALAFYGMGTPVTDFAPATRLTILAVQLVFIMVAFPASQLLHSCARMMAGATTLLAALTAISVFAIENFLASNLAINLVGELPSVTLASVASLVLAASLALLARNATRHWLMAGICLSGAGLFYLFPVHQLVITKHVAGRANELLAGEMASLPEPWVLVDNRLADGGGLHFRHRLAPLEARLAPAAGSRFSLATVETVGKRLQEEHRQRAGVVACILSTVDSKPHQLRLLSLGKEKTAVLIVQTSSGVQTLMVSGKQEIFDRYASDIQKLFSIMD